ncbi:hypothetical protein OPIT5_30160 [Opitutaceae bacterium TAV5]|nr:hypothetical protein OPIT5_30160 [Opitutaceae bacterium TAV5]
MYIFKVYLMTKTSLLLNVVLFVLYCGVGVAEPAVTKPVFPVATEAGDVSVFLDASGDPKNAPDGGKTPVLSGELVTHDADTTPVAWQDGVRVRSFLKKGWHNTKAKFRWELPVAAGAPVLPAGRYEVWARYAQSGQASQNVSIYVGGQDNKAGEERLKSVHNVPNWELQWSKAEKTLFITDEDKFIEIETSGFAAHQKNIAGFWLLKIADWPAGITSAGWRLRQKLTIQPDAKKVTARLVVIEGKTAAMSDPALSAIDATLNAQPALREQVAVSVIPGEFADADTLSDAAKWRWTEIGRRDMDQRENETAAALAQRLSLKVLPAVVLTTPAQQIIKTWEGPFTAENTRVLREEIHAALGNGTPVAAAEAAPAGTSATPAIADAARMPESGVPEQWLVLGTWAGPAGLGMWGLDYEPVARPSPGDPEIVTWFDPFRRKRWAVHKADASKGGRVIVEKIAPPYLPWAGGAAYAHLYIWSPDARRVALCLAHTGDGTAGWLNGKTLAWKADSSPAAANAIKTLSSDASTTGNVAATSDQGGSVTVKKTSAGSAWETPLELERGWNRVLVKIFSSQAKDETLAFSSRFVPARSSASASAAEVARTMAGLRVSCRNPAAAEDVLAAAGRFVPRVKTSDAHNLNLVPQNQPALSIEVDLQSEDLLAGTVAPFRPWRGQLELRMTDYDGAEIYRRTRSAVFPGVFSFDLPSPPSLPRGYYALQLNLLDARGNIIRACAPDGFSVVGGTIAQHERQPFKKMSVNYYYMAQTGHYKTLYFPYMERVGVFRNLGGSIFPHDDFFKEAAARNIDVMADLDLHTDPKIIEDFVQRTKPFVSGFKGTNEINIRYKVRGSPEAWVAKAKREYEIVKRLAPDMIMTGASFGSHFDSWFEECLKLGLDKYHDVWDVHTYPKDPPALGGSMSNNDLETEFGVLRAYKKLGMKNTKPWWIGETGARASHGHDGRRWQAGMLAKMVACSLSRDDFQIVSFLVPWDYPREGPGTRMHGYIIGDMGYAHMPADAAFYTASALIDGFPSLRVPSATGGGQADSDGKAAWQKPGWLKCDYERLRGFPGDAPVVQAARFGPTVMAWTTDNRPRKVSLPLAKSGASANALAIMPHVIVDVIGRARALAANDITPARDGAGAIANVTIDDSPVYILARAEYERLTRF